MVTPEAIANTKNSNTDVEDASKDLGGDAEIIASLKEYHNDDPTDDGEAMPPDGVKKNASPKEDHSDVSRSNGEVKPPNDVGDGELKPPNDVGAACDIEGVLDVKENAKPMDDLEKREPAEHIQHDSSMTSEEPLELDTEDQPTCLDKGADSQGEDFDSCSISEDPIPRQTDGELQKDSESKEPIKEKPDVGNGRISQQAGDLELFEEGSILIEYVRKEAACAAAHCLHRRTYGDQIVVVGYVPYDIYLVRFPR